MVQRLIYVLFFLSGFSALVYELCWLRELGLVLGTTLPSISITTSAFMAGLALGSWFFGKRADRLPRVLRFYSGLELVIGITAILVLGIFSRFADLIRAVHHLTGDGPAFTLLRFAGTFGLLLIPCTVIGGTLPVISRYVVRHLSELGNRVGVLYSVNTIGAALGAGTTGYFLIERFGLSTTVGIAAVINLLVAAAAFVLSRSEPEVAPDTEPAPAAVDDRLLTRICTIAFFLSGLTGLAYEIVWTRILVGFYSNRPFVFTTILVIFLLGLAGGGAIGSKLVDRIQRPALVLGGLLGGLGLMSVASLGYLDLFPERHGQIYYVPGLPQILYTLLILGPPCLLMGFNFPLLTRVLIRETRTVASTLGRYYALNTIGAILGGLSGSFIFIELIGSSQSVVVLGLGNLVLGVVFLAVGGDRTPKSAWGLGAVLLAACAWMGHQGWDSYHRNMSETALLTSRGTAEEALYHEDAEATLLMFKEAGGYRLQVNGSPAVAFLTDETKLMAHIPLMLVKEPKRALVICFGMGNTFRSALSHGIDVDVAEINSTIPTLTRIYRKDPEATLAHPHGKIIINDGRNHLLMTDQLYDMITVDPAPPMTGVGTVNLYTREFFELGRNRLKPGGVFMQWTPVYDGYDFVRILRAFTDVFPEVAMLRGIQGRAYYLIGSSSPLVWNRARIDAVLNDPRIKADLDEVSPGFFDLDALSRLYIGDRNSLRDLFERVPPMTDDWPVMEYKLLRNVAPEEQLPYPLAPRQALPLVPI